MFGKHMYHHYRGRAYRAAQYFGGSPEQAIYGPGCGPRGRRRHGMGFGFGPPGPMFGDDGLGDGFDAGRGRSGPGGRRGRVIGAEQLRLVLLHLIEAEARHGYDLIRAIEEMTGGSYAPSPGMVYPMLSMLDEMGLIEAQQTDGARKAFAITEAGTAELTTHAEEVARLLERLKSLAPSEEEGKAAGDRAPVRRAMAGLHIAVRQRMMAGASREDAHAIAELLDKVTREIERL